MTDNDLKYRYIKSTSGISREGLKKLEDIFEYCRDQKEIRKIRQKVKEFEKKFDAAAQNLNEK